eukprot:TRINITY_DN5574_c0_g1_i2.p1 TRINITY_DN5574_c0_g1~~TRINITY_DN5574_c0_g1_i2.p1  ORF type:complete len:133 (-),score=9.12 TRINITY_DN5574_c0_g1_i2:96-494(-)
MDKKEPKDEGLKPGTRIFVQRDWSHGVGIRFSEKFPDELKEIVDSSEFTNTIARINQYFDEAEKSNIYTFAEGCLGCLTCFSSFLLIESRYSRFMRLMNQFRESENKNVYRSKNLEWLDPEEIGFMRVRIGY